MAGDRDLAVALLQSYPRVRHRPRTGWEMMGATGVRGLRLLTEAGPFDAFVFTEANPEAIRVLSENARTHPEARVEGCDARHIPTGAPFDYVDLDPYGTPAPFLPAALEAVRPGGLLAVTATDMMVLAGVQPGACERRYGARPIRGRLGPEGGLRILLAYLARAARERGRTIRPLFCYVRDHHVRASVEVRESVSDRDPVGGIDPASWSGPFVGDRGPYGPLWLGPLFDRELVLSLRTPSTAARPHETEQFLERVRDEVAVDVPFYYEANTLAAALDLAEPPALAALLGALRDEGHRAARTHARPEGFRTDAPRPIVEAIARRLSGSPQSQNARVRA
jgi:tRNA (guanine26-N2/guanine27-N2)-dimethyltransferase